MTSSRGRDIGNWEARDPGDQNPQQGLQSSLTTGVVSALAQDTVGCSAKLQSSPKTGATMDPLPSLETEAEQTISDCAGTGY